MRQHHDMISKFQAVQHLYPRNSTLLEVPLLRATRTADELYSLSIACAGTSGTSLTWTLCQSSDLNQGGVDFDPSHRFPSRQRRDTGPRQVGGSVLEKAQGRPRMESFVWVRLTEQQMYPLFFM